MPGIVNIVIVIAVVALAIVGVGRAVGSATGRRDCCSGARRDAAGGAHVAVVDHDASHYPYSYGLRVGGMSCERCAATVEDALNALGGIWATVDLREGRARVLSKAELDPAALLATVREAGYEARLTD